MGDHGGPAADHPFKGFDVLAHAYPNHTYPSHADPTAEPLAVESVATELMTALAERWLLPAADLADWEISEPTEGDHSGEFALYIGPIDERTDDFRDPVIVIVRETAGGGLMVLLSHNGRPHADRIRSYAQAILDRRSLPTTGVMT